MRVVLCCATRRGLLFFERLVELLPSGWELSVVSFREEPHEPPFLDALRAACAERGAGFTEARRVGAEDCDLFLAVSWRYLLPPEVYRRARLGAFVLHDSLLPTYRGFSPTVWAIANGEERTGVSLFAMADAVDAGDIVGQREVAIGRDETIADVMDRVTASYLELLEEHLPALLAGNAPATPQDHSVATFCCKRLLEDNRIDWSRSTRQVHDLVRAVTRPYPGALTEVAGRSLTVWATQRLEPEPVWVGRVPGRVVEVRPGEGSIVLTGNGALLVTRVQLAGDEERCASEVLDRPSLTLGAAGAR